MRGLLHSKSDVINKPQTSACESQEEKSESLLREHGIFHRHRYRHQENRTIDILYIFMSEFIALTVMYGDDYNKIKPNISEKDGY